MSDEHLESCRAEARPSAYKIESRLHLRRKAEMFGKDRCASIALLLMAAARPPVEAPKDELSGTWVIESAISPIGDDEESLGRRLTFAGGVMKPAPAPLTQITYVLDRTSQPHAIDFLIPGKTEPHQWGIYRVNGNRLTLCTVFHDRTTGPDEAEVEARRPTAFEVRPQPQWWLFQLRKIR